MSNVMQFDESPRKVYKRTFLNTVFVVLSYSIEEVTEQLLTAVNQFLRDNFNTQEEASVELFKKGFSIDNEEKGVSYFFSAKHVGVKYMKDDYVSFQQTMMPLIYPLMSFFKNVISIDLIDVINIRKVNIWSVKLNEGKPFNESQFANDFLSSSLISQAEARDNNDKEPRNAHYLSGETNSFEFGILYGFLDREFNNAKYCCLTLDEHVIAKGIQATDVETVLLKANNTLYNIFHWSVSKRTLAYMEKEI